MSFLLAANAPQWNVQYQGFETPRVVVQFASIAVALLIAIVTVGVVIYTILQQL